MSVRIDFTSALGLAVLYSSSFFLPLVATQQSYFVPSVQQDVAYPSVVAIVLLTAALTLSNRYWTRRPESPVRGMVFLVMLSAFAVIALRSILAAAGFGFVDVALIIHGPDASPAAVRWLRVTSTCVVFLGAVTAMWLLRSRGQAVLRFFACLGFAYALLAIIRVAAYASDDSSARPPSPRSAGLINSADAAESAEHANSTRRAVWVIFDEFDYRLTWGPDSASEGNRLPNLARLRDISVVAEQAYPPAKDTSESIPALLTGRPVRGARFDGRGRLFSQGDGSDESEFSEARSLFARLPHGAGSAAILGYYHPYCRVFQTVEACSSFFVGNAGRWFDALIFFGDPVVSAMLRLPRVAEQVPARVLYLFEPMYRISAEQVSDLPRFLTMDDKALMFIHLNVPHYPAAFAQRALNLRAVADERASYRQNLVLVDRLIGQIVGQLERNSNERDTLLVISSDHWRRIDSPTQAQPVPFVAWHVGERHAARLVEPVSTVHTSALILDFISGRVTTHPDIVNWWRDKPTYATWIPRNQKY